MEEQINYRLILILENIPHAAASYQVRLDGRSLELTDDEPILAVYTDIGVHNIEVSSSPTVRESTSFRVQPGQRITKVFVRPTAHKIDLEVDFGLRARQTQFRESQEAEARSAPAPAAARPPALSRRGTWAAWLAFMFLSGLVCGLLLSLIIWPARPRAGTTAPAQTAETPELPENGERFAIEFRDARLTRDAADEIAIVITYAWTNNSGETVNAADLFQAKAFQNGVQLDAAEIYDIGLYDPTAYTRALRPEAATELQAVFRLASEADVVEFEVAPLPGIPGTPMIESFDPADMELYVPTETEAPSPPP